MTPNQAAILGRLDNILSDFLKAYAVKRLNNLMAEQRIENLREITFSGNPQYSHMDSRFKALESWFLENAPEISRAHLNDELIQQIIDCVNQIGALSRGELDPSDSHKILFDRNRAGRVASMAGVFLERSKGEKAISPATTSLKLTRPPEARGSFPEGGPAKGDSSKDKFLDSLNYQLKTLEYYGDDKYHLFSIVDQLLKNLEQKPDIKVSHLAASILYFLKINGYKVAPYVEKLRALSRNLNGR